MRRSDIIALTLTGAMLTGISGCATQQKLKAIKQRDIRATITLPEQKDYLPPVQGLKAKADTFTVMDGDRKLLIMNAVQDEDGNMVAHQQLDGAVVVARFRNIAERNGQVDLQFQVIVPQSMQDGAWQLRFFPDMYVMEDSVRLESVVITGKDYRRAQLRGYQQYERFLSRIIQDTSRFVNVWQLELFIERNIPELYAFKTDTSRVSDEQFASVYGVTEEEAIEHYTNKIARSMNRSRIRKREKMFRRYVKVPITSEGLRLDTVMQSSTGNFIYNYTQTLKTRPKLRKVDIVLSGEIWESDRVIHEIPRSEPLTFYISSLSSFVDNTERYLTKVIERRAEANTACYIDFALGKSTVDETLSSNAGEIGRIKGNLTSLMENREYDLDSIVVTASASPEGTASFNYRLSQKRSKGISDYFGAWMRHLADSLTAAKGFRVDEEGNVIQEKKQGTIPFISRSDGENWRMLDRLVDQDTLMTEKDRKDYFRIRKGKDMDANERKMQKESWYRHLRETVYPRLRTVKFDFHLHRKGMVKDTVHTTILDSTYMNGVQALRDRDYELAVTLLRPYRDYNAALAFMSLDYNANASEIVETLAPSPEVNYLKAILHSRRGEDKEAVQCYLDACRENPGYVHRGNLDPEISVLIKRYGLNREEEEDFTF